MRTTKNQTWLALPALIIVVSVNCNERSSSAPNSDEAAPAAPPYANASSGDSPRTAADKIIEVVGKHYATTEERNESITSALKQSGSANNELQAAGERMRLRLTENRLAVVPSESGCYRAGCYFYLARFSEQELVRVRDEAANGFAMLITPDPPPSKMLLLLNTLNPPERP